jgi:hypothetical protein
MRIASGFFLYVLLVGCQSDFDKCMDAESAKAQKLVDLVRKNNSELTERISKIAEELQEVRRFISFANKNENAIVKNFTSYFGYSAQNPEPEWSSSEDSEYAAWEADNINQLPYPEVYSAFMEFDYYSVMEDWAEENSCWGAEQGEYGCEEDIYMAWYKYQNPGESEYPSWYTTEFPTDSDNRRIHDLELDLLEKLEEAKEAELAELEDTSGIKLIAQEVCNSRGLYD